MVHMFRDDFWQYDLERWIWIDLFQNPVWLFLRFSTTDELWLTCTTTVTKQCPDADTQDTNRRLSKSVQFSVTLWMLTRNEYL